MAFRALGCRADFQAGGPPRISGRAWPRGTAREKGEALRGGLNPSARIKIERLLDEAGATAGKIASARSLREILDFRAVQHVFVYSELS